MCRLAGWYRPEFPERTDRPRLLKHLMRKSQAGGEASFGMAIVQDGKPKMVRHIGPASTWLEGHKKDIAEFAKAEAIMGHTRQPTRGAVTKANCHPFTIGEWAAAHNGCISNSSSLMEASLYAPRGETDSEEALCYIISTDWDTEAIDKVSGSFAFTGLKDDGSEMVLVCDRVQNLHYVRFGNGLVWATSAIVLKSSLAAVGIDATPVKMSKQIIRIPAWTTEEVDSSYTTYQGGHGYTGYTGYHGYGTPATAPSKPTFPIVPKDDDKDKVCKGCDHIAGVHNEPSGCHAVIDKRLCPCAEFIGKEEKDVDECPGCKHDKQRHSSSWGCLEHDCKCEMGKLPVINGSSQPNLPIGTTIGTDEETELDKELNAYRESQEVNRMMGME